MEEGKYTIYKHTSPNGKVYIGITSQSVTARWGKNGRGYRRQSHFWNAIQKYGWDCFKHEILATGVSKEAASIAEKKLIKRYDSRNPKKGYNQDAGGHVNSGGWHHTEEVKRLLSESKLGEKNPMYGSHHTEEFKEKARITSSFKRSDETKAKMSYAQSHRSEEYKKKLYDAAKRSPVRCIETGEVYIGVYAAGRETGIQGANISKCIRGLRETAGGLHWEYALDLQKQADTEVNAETKESA